MILKVSCECSKYKQSFQSSAQVYITLYFTFALINDLIGSNEIIANEKTTVPFVRKVRDFMFSSGTISISIGVSVYFWGLYVYDYRLLLPNNVDEIEPKWYNHMVHTFNTVFMVIELLWTHHRYPSNFIMTLWSCTYMTGYFVWMIFLKYKTDAWPYPIFSELPPVPRVGFMIMTVVLQGVLNLILKFVNYMVWKSRVDKMMWSE